MGPNEKAPATDCNPGEGNENQPTHSNMKGFTLTHLNTSPLAQINSVAISQDDAPTLHQWQYESANGAPCDLEMILDPEDGPVFFAQIAHSRYNQADHINGMTIEDMRRLRHALDVVIEHAARYAGMRVAVSGVAA